MFDDGIESVVEHQAQPEEERPHGPRGQQVSRERAKRDEHGDERRERHDGAERVIVMVAEVSEVEGFQA